MKKLLGVIGAVGLVLLAVTGAAGARSEATRSIRISGRFLVCSTNIPSDEISRVSAVSIPRAFVGVDEMRLLCGALMPLAACKADGP